MSHDDLPDLPSSGDEDDCPDGDTVDPFQLELCFREKFKITDESALSIRNTYILRMAHDSNFTRIAAGLSNGAVHVLDTKPFTALTTIPPMPLPVASREPVSICGVRFLDESPNNLLVGTTNGAIRLFDLRTQNEQACFVDSSTPNNAGKEVPPKPIACFDRNANSRVICAGTSQCKQDVYLLFFDVRERQLLGGYFESHEDDVTSVQYHPQNPDLLCSGSVDGLINVFDTLEEVEDDALQITINTEDSVQKLHWHKDFQAKDIISCVTTTNEYKAYESQEGDQIVAFDRRSIAAGIKRQNPANCDLIDAHNLADGSVFLLAGTNSHKGEVLRSVRLQNKDIVPHASFEGNKQIVRESLYFSPYNMLVTGGEGGIVSVWAPGSGAAPNPTGPVGKVKGRSKHKATPY